MISVEIKTSIRAIKGKTTFFPLVEVEKELIRDGEFLGNLSRNLRDRGFPDFFLKEDDSSIVIWIPVSAAEHIIGISCSKIMVEVHWNRNIPIY